MKILLALLAIVLIYWILRTLSAGKRREKGKSAPAPKMIACDHCGLHVPENEAIRKEAHVYCCAEHEKLGPK